MRLPRVRFTVRRMMVAVGIVAILLVMEINVAAYARNLVSDLGDGEDYIQGEAVTVWAILQVPMILALYSVSLIRHLFRQGEATLVSTSPEVCDPPEPG